MKSYREFLAWQKAMTFVTSIYKTTSTFPESERFGLTSQLRRAAVSIPSNFAEGFGRFQNKSFINFIRISIGSLYEVQTQLQIAVNCELLNQDDYDALFSESENVLYLMKGVIKSLMQD